MPITMSGRNGEVDFQIRLDRQSALDIGAFVVDGVNISPGTAIPSDGDPRIDRALQGFLFTCGPDHIRHPEPVEGVGGDRMFPLHGSLCATPVRRAQMSALGETAGYRAEMEVALANGGTALVSRQWTICGESGEIMLGDRVTNIGRMPFAPMIMYHMNIGGWLAGDDTSISGTMFGNDEIPWRFGAGESAHFCVPAAASAVDGWAHMTLGPFAALSDRSLTLRFSVETLPFLQMWRCQRDAADVISIEPVSHRIAKRTELARAGEMQALQTGDSRDYALAFGIV